MKIIWIFLLLLTSLLSIGINQINALQQVAGPIVIEIKPGETKTIQWGLVSDKEYDVTVVELKSDGNGAEFLSFPKTQSIDPGQLTFVDVTVTIPKNTSNAKLSPTISATEYDKSKGAILLNIKMEKTVLIIIDSQNETEFELQENLVAKSTKNTKMEPKNGSCLIATAAFGSEMASQVQQLRETRDDVVMKTQSGTAFMTAFNSVYYTFAPAVADWERANPIFKEMVKVIVTPLITTLSILNYIPIHSESEMLFYGIGVILLNIGMYFVAPAVVLLRLKQPKK